MCTLFNIYEYRFQTLLEAVTMTRFSFLPTRTITGKYPLNFFENANSLCNHVRHLQIFSALIKVNFDKRSIWQQASRTVSRKR